MRFKSKNYLVPLVEFMYLVFTHMPGESYRLRSVWLYFCYVFRALIISLVSSYLTNTKMHSPWARCRTPPHSPPGGGGGGFLETMIFG